MRFCSPAGAEAADDLDDERILGQALAEGAKVLLGEHGGRHEHGDLLAVVDGLERGPHGQLGLAVADVAADEAVHRPGPLHVALDLGHGGELIGRFLDRERRPRTRAASRVSGGKATPGWASRSGLQLDHVAGQVEDRRLDLLLLALPAGAAELRQLRVGLGAADVFLHQIDLRRRHVDAGAVAELEDEVLFGLPVLLEHLHAAIAGDAVADVDDEVALAAGRGSCRWPAIRAAAAAATCRASSRWNSS